MLILTRKSGETIHFDLTDGRKLTIQTKIRGDTIRLAIDAPQTVRIRRGELRPHKPEKQTA